MEDKARAAKKLRVLALHSFRTSGDIFEQQLTRAKVKQQLDDLVEVVFLDSPHPASGPAPRDVRPYFAGPYLEWFTAEQVGDRVEFDVAKLEASQAHIEAFMAQHGPFDGLMGFSQGAVMSAAVASMQRSGTALQSVPQLKFVVLFAGMKSRYPAHMDAFAHGGHKVRLPSLHIFGDKDALKHPHCVDLADTFEGSVVIMHPRGHVIPQLEPHQLAVTRAFLSSFQQPSALSKL